MTSHHITFILFIRKSVHNYYTNNYTTDRRLIRNIVFDNNNNSTPI